jgi:hypothetical protein
MRPPVNPSSPKENSQSKVAMLFEEPTERSKTGRMEDIVGRLAADPETKGEVLRWEKAIVLPLDETNMMFQTVLRFTEAVVDSQQISIAIPGKRLQRHGMPPNSY